MPAVLALLLFVLVLALLFTRNRQHYMLHQERMAALDKGTAIPLGPEPAPWSPRAYLLRGLIWSFSGVALIVCLLGISWSSRERPSAESTLWAAKGISRNFDVPLDQARQILEQNQSRTGFPVGVATLGAIPLAVGLAYLVFYFTDDSRKQLPAAAPSEAFTPRS